LGKIDIKPFFIFSQSNDMYIEITKILTKVATLENTEKVAFTTPEEIFDVSGIISVKDSCHSSGTFIPEIIEGKLTSIFCTSTTKGGTIKVITATSTKTNNRYDIKTAIPLEIFLLKRIFRMKYLIGCSMQITTKVAKKIIPMIGPSL
ncbi:MAG TPA: hypothetical protein PLW49_02840, partial [bacterium]|nr:hypothetical protein [bacterium]